MAMKARSRWIEGFRSVLDNGRRHSVVVDLPENLGGADTGPTALELAVMALAGCITTIFSMVAKKMRLEFEGAEAVVEAEKGEATIEKCTITLKVKTKEPRERVERAWELTWKTCPVGILFARAGVEVEHRVEVVE